MSALRRVAVRRCGGRVAGVVTRWRIALVRSRCVARRHRLNPGLSRWYLIGSTARRVAVGLSRLLWAGRCGVTRLAVLQLRSCLRRNSSDGRLGRSCRLLNLLYDRRGFWGLAYTDFPAVSSAPP